ncbi:MAG: hypothetical protein ABFR02_01995 [Campylobacterota bacterium]
MKKLLISTIVSLAPMVMAANSEAVNAVAAESGEAHSEVAAASSAIPNHELINQQIQEIKPPRVGVKAADVLKTKSPFILFEVVKDGKKKTTYVVKKKVKFKPLRMETSINKSVKINGKWYKEGDRVRHYTIVKVSAGEALLKSKKKELRLFQNQKNDKINFAVN